MRKFLAIALSLLLFYSASSQRNLPHTEKKIESDTSKLGSVLNIDLLKKIKKQVDKSLEKEIDDALKALRANTLKEPENRIEITGLGNIANSQNGQGLSPSANLITKLIPIAKDPNLSIYLGYNLGAELDSTKIDSLKLGSLFLPDRGKSGYSFRMEYNILPRLGRGSNKNENYSFSTELNPFVEYNYNKLNIEDVHADSSKIQTSTWIYGINLYHQLKRNDNIVSLQVTPFFKKVIVTDGTLKTYQNIFNPALKNIEAPQKVNFIGLILGFQLNRFQFSFIVEDLKTKSLKDTPINGGVYTVRATVVGDFLRL